MMSSKIKFQHSPCLWFDTWKAKGIDMTSVETQELTHYDLSVIKMFISKGTDFFARQDIWRVDWDRLFDLAKKSGYIAHDTQFVHPKKRFLIRLFHLYMKITIDIKIIRYFESKIFTKSFLY